MTLPVPFRAGAARVVITPPLGISIEGSFTPQAAETILDDLYANALILDDGDTVIALLAMDLCQIDTRLSRHIAAEVERRCSIPQTHTFVTSSHTHNGPAVGGIVVEDDAVAWDYVNLLPRQAATAVALALQRSRPATLTVGRADNPNHAFCRRLRRPDGSPIMNWHNKQLLQECEPLGPIDPDVLVLTVEDRETRRPLAFVVNHALHNNAAAWHRTGISADFSGVMGDTLRRVYGPDVVTLFLPGAMGDINWIDFRDVDVDLPRIYRRIGEGLAGTVMQVAAAASAVQNPALAVRCAALPISERPWDAADLSDKDVFQLEEHLETSPFFQAYQAWQRAGSPPPETRILDLRAIQIGDDIALVANQSEFFVELGMEVKTRSPYPFTFVATLTNGNVGYVPTRRAFTEGGYEVKKYPENSFLAVDAGELMVETSTRLLHELPAASDRTPATSSG